MKTTHPGTTTSHFMLRISGCIICNGDMFLYKKERDCMCVCVCVCVCSCTLWISNPGNWPTCFEGGCQCKVCKVLTIPWNGAKAPNPKSRPAPSPSPQVEETHRTSPMNSSPSSNSSKLCVSSETSEKRGRTFHPYSPLFVSFSIVFIHLGCILCHSKGLTIKEGRIVLLGHAFKQGLCIHFGL
jgi:hypothetical protein